MMRDLADRNIPPSKVGPEALESAVKAYTGRTIGVTAEVLSQLLDAMHCVRERKYRGGAAPERVREHIGHARANISEDRKFVTAAMSRIEAAERRMTTAFAALQKRYGGGEK
jgi:hypothetical protein